MNETSSSSRYTGLRITLVTVHQFNKESILSHVI
ncbi:unnamed protein product, partial [Rotaria sp. Silwood1]